MSKKTDNIYKSISKIEELENTISKLNDELNNRQLDDVDFQLKQEIKNLRFWIDSLYHYNGKSTSNAKKNASRENGKKGGRPPKIITELKRKKIMLEDETIPELERMISFAETSEQESQLKKSLEACKNELSEINQRLETEM